MRAARQRVFDVAVLEPERVKSEWRLERLLLEVEDERLSTHEFRPSLRHSLACDRRACGRSSPLYVARKVASRWRGCRCGHSLLVSLDVELIVHQKGGSW